MSEAATVVTVAVAMTEAENSQARNNYVDTNRFGSCDGHRYEYKYYFPSKTNVDVRGWDGNEHRSTGGKQ